MDQKSIGAFIRDIRKEKGMTQEQLAERLGVSQKSVSRWETGKTMPDYSLLPSICEELGVNAAELLGAKRIEGDSISKNQADAMAKSMISLMDDRVFVRKIIGAAVSVIITLLCVVCLYRLEFSVHTESTSDLEQAINEYHFVEEVSADILERQVIGNRLYVLYGENEYPGACGLACLQRGIFGSYRIISCSDSNNGWINIDKVTVGKKQYCAAYCVNELPEIDSYGICGVREEDGPDLTVDDSYLLYKLDYTGSPFLSFTEIEDGVGISPFHTKYFIGNTELSDDELEALFGDCHVDGAPNSGTSTVELGLFYVLEGIVILLGVVFVRYFLTDDSVKRKRIQISFY